jgi:CLIP-associating protein 1/2
MLQLEGMVLGGASRLGNFLDELRNLKDALTEQLNDRRSAVSRVACHLLGELAVTLGNKFEPLAVHFLPYMMKVSVISVQVMADAAVDGMETIVRHCRARGAVVPILNAIISERNKVMRTHCSKVFLLMLEVPPHPSTATPVPHHHRRHLRRAAKCLTPLL